MICVVRRTFCGLWVVGDPENTPYGTVKTIYFGYNCLMIEMKQRYRIIW